MVLCYFGVLIVICHAQLTQAIAQCVRPTYSEYGHHLSGHVITTSKTSSITECVMFCLNESRCKSLNFRLKDKSCDLNAADKRTHPRDFGPKEGSVYMNKVWYWRILYKEIKRNNVYLAVHIKKLCYLFLNPWSSHSYADLRDDNVLIHLSSHFCQLWLAHI